MYILALIVSSLRVAKQYGGDTERETEKPKKKKKSV